MRYLACFCLLLVFSTAIQSQKTYRALSVYTTLAEDGDNFGLFWVSGSGRPGISQNRSFMLGVEHTWGLDRAANLSIGLEYSQRSIAATFYKTFPNHDENTTGTLALLSVPVYFRLDFTKWLFITTGGTIDLQVKNNVISNQSGIGATGGVGLKFDFKIENKPVSFLFHPYYQLHNIIPLFHSDGRDHLINAGLRAVLLYQFK
jgi:hypothetical protein